MNNFIWGAEVGAGGFLAIITLWYVGDRISAVYSKFHWWNYMRLREKRHKQKYPSGCTTAWCEMCYPRGKANAA